MAKVFKFFKIPRDSEQLSLQDNMDFSLTHVHSPRDGSLCGIQTDGESGLDITELFDGPVTCPQCRQIIEAVQKIKRWR